MLRFKQIAQISIFITAIGFSSAAHAGFEWVPPAKKPIPLTQEIPVQAQSSHPAQISTTDDMSSDAGAFPAPTVTAEPLSQPSSQSMPTSILPDQTNQQSVPQATAQRPKNLSGKKLIIDPYPLRNNQPTPATTMSMTEIYKGMNEEAGKLNPVKLGNGMTTGAKAQAEPIAVPKPVRMASRAHKTFLTPTGDGMTPMLGAEPEPLPGMAISNEAVKSMAPQKVYAEAVGFGRDLPLALALSQVVPSEFNHSYAKDVDAGASVSWEGGKPWNEVLNDMLKPVGMTAAIQGKQVIIQPLSQS